jgi:putative FmdB family regulatory protein
MPVYQFACTKCNHVFDQYLKIEERELPTKDKCPNCKKKGVQRDYNNFSQTIGSDATLTPDRATGGRWNELMGRMKKGLSKRHHKNLDEATARTGKYWRG